MALPKTFTGGERLFAGDLNDNFEALDTRLATAESEIDTNASNLNASNLTSGTVATARMPAGNVIAAGEGETSTEVSVTGSTFTDIGVSVTITPRSTGSRMLIMATPNISLDSGAGSSAVGEVRVLRDETEIFKWAHRQASNDGVVEVGSSKITIDEPNTGAAVTYKIQIRKVSGGSIIASRFSSLSSMAVLEIAG
jgi:hypothetical protein